MSEMEDKSSVQWAIDLVSKNHEHYKSSVLTEYFNEVSFTLLGISAPAVRNYVLRRPILSGFHMHILCAIGGWYVGWRFSKKDDFVYGRRDAMLLDYIKLHPECFPEPERKKFGDVFDPWSPVR